MGVIAGTFKYSVGIQSGPNIEEILLGKTDTVQQGQIQSLMGRNYFWRNNEKYERHRSAGV